MELRLKGLARATKDIDLTYSGPDKDHVAALDDALRGGYGDFTFRRTAEPYRMSRARTVRVEIAVSYRGQTWGSVTVDIGEAEGHRLEIEMVPGFDLREFGIEGPANLACLSARYHLAHKIHGMTSPGQDGLQNDRVQDAVDALLLSELVTDLTAAREACVEVFRVRNTHNWPPRFEPPEGVWEAPYARMAADLKLQPDNLQAASTRLRELIAAIDGDPTGNTPST
jgi:hypothetical protein